MICAAASMNAGDIQARPRSHAVALLSGLMAAGLMLVWAVGNGGYDEATWYWGALLLLAALSALLVSGRARIASVSPAIRIALALFAAYVGWSYLSIAWAGSPGDALQGSNRALLYLLVFALLVSLPWTPQSALAVLSSFVVGVGVIALAMLVRLANADHLAGLVIEGRLAAPTGYFNATAALFTLDALTAIALAARREVPWLLRGLLLALACAGLQLGVIVQSRGWLFTLPFVIIAAIAVSPDRLRFVAACVLPAAGALAPLHRLLHVYQSSSVSGTVPPGAATQAGHPALLICAAVFALGTVLAWADSRTKLASINARRRRLTEALAAVIAILALAVGGVTATHGHPIRFISRQWRGFSHPQQIYSRGSHFSDVGSGRYDFWRVSLDALIAHPIGGLGQDNFADYYVRHRRTAEEPSWTHSLPMRLLAHTGIVGFLLFGAFIVTAVAAALRTTRRSSPLHSAVAGAAVMPSVVWLIYGSVDWFWEFPALSAPALGFLGVAAALGPRAHAPSTERPPERVRAFPEPTRVVIGAVALTVAVVALGLPYLSVREVSAASATAGHNPLAALDDLTVASELNPLSAVPGRVAGAIALRTGLLTVAQQRFNQATTREPGGWFAWLGAGLAASALGNTDQAHHDYQVAAAINSRQPAVKQAASRVNTTRPLTPSQAFALLVLAR